MRTFQLLILTTILFTLPNVNSIDQTEDETDSWKDIHKTIEDGRIRAKEAIDISSDPYTFESDRYIAQQLRCYNISINYCLCTPAK